MGYLFTGFGFAAAICLWLIFAPTGVGGNSDYVIITGNSMTPEFKSGDLVIVQRLDGYQPGDIVAYQDHLLNKVIFHRILTINGNHFILKGDHNTWTDSSKPTQEDILGKFWIRIPAAGEAAIFIRNPILLSILAGIITALIILSLTRKPVRREATI